MEKCNSSLHVCFLHGITHISYTSSGQKAGTGETEIKLIYQRISISLYPFIDVMEDICGFFLYLWYFYNYCWMCLLTRYRSTESSILTTYRSVDMELKYGCNYTYSEI
jgi:hypothetical protein